MWRRTYLLLLLVRIYLALSPSYIHPDENFQGPEIIAGEFLRTRLPSSPVLPRQWPRPSHLMTCISLL